MASITIKGLDELLKRVGNANSRLDGILRDTTKESAEVILPKLKANTPKDSGNLQDSEEIVYANGGLRAEIGPDPTKAPYAPFVELGHHTRSGSFVPGQRFIERTLLENKRDVKERYIKAVRLLLKTN